MVPTLASSTLRAQKPVPYDHPTGHQPSDHRASPLAGRRRPAAGVAGVPGAVADAVEGMSLEHRAADAGVCLHLVPNLRRPLLAPVGDAIESRRPTGWPDA